VVAGTASVVETGRLEKTSSSELADSSRSSPSSASSAGAGCSRRSDSAGVVASVSGRSSYGKVSAHERDAALPGNGTNGSPWW